MHGFFILEGDRIRGRKIHTEKREDHNLYACIWWQCTHIEKRQTHIQYFLFKCSVQLNSGVKGDQKDVTSIFRVQDKVINHWELSVSVA